MLAFTVGVLFGVAVAFLIVGFWAVVSDDDERHYLKQVEERRLKQEATKDSQVVEDRYGRYFN